LRNTRAISSNSLTARQAGKALKSRIGDACVREVKVPKRAQLCQVDEACVSDLRTLEPEANERGELASGSATKHSVVRLAEAPGMGYELVGGAERGAIEQRHIELLYSPRG
jgi:hypothetical protein